MLQDASQFASNIDKMMKQSLGIAEAEVEEEEEVEEVPEAEEKEEKAEEEEEDEKSSSKDEL